MRFFTILSAALSFGSLASLVAGVDIVVEDPGMLLYTSAMMQILILLAEVESAEEAPEGLLASAVWPESNPFGRALQVTWLLVHI